MKEILKKLSQFFCLKHDRTSHSTTHQVCFKCDKVVERKPRKKSKIPVRRYDTKFEKYDGAIDKTYGRDF